jgi:hypothetical protein
MVLAEYALTGSLVLDSSANTRQWATDSQQAIGSLSVPAGKKLLINSLVPKDGAIYNACSLLPINEIVQAKSYLSPPELEAGINPGGGISLVRIGEKNIAVIICTDLREIGRISTDGADLIVFVFHFTPENLEKTMEDLIRISKERSLPILAASLSSDKNNGHSCYIRGATVVSLGPGEGILEVTVCPGFANEFLFPHKKPPKHPTGCFGGFHLFRFRLYRPRSSPIRITLILPAGRQSLVVTISAQMLSALRQSSQAPVLKQGVRSFSNRCATAGAAMVLVRRSPSSGLLTTLFIPAATMTLFGPNIIAASRFPFPSIFTSWPSSLTALLLIKNVSQCSACRMSSVRSASSFAVSRSMTRYPSCCRRIWTPISFSVSEPPHDTRWSLGIRVRICCRASAARFQYYASK